jgi:hypothetical protein
MVDKLHKKFAAFYELRGAHYRPLYGLSTVPILSQINTASTLPVNFNIILQIYTEILQVVFLVFQVWGHNVVLKTSFENT